MESKKEAKVLDFLKRTLTDERRRHVLGVVELAGKLAERFGLDSDRVRLAGALHDVARCWTQEELHRYTRKYRVRVPDLKFILKYQPILLHSYVGAHIARRRFKIKDREILSAIAKHSLGSIKMTAFEKCVYMADLLAPDRDFYGADRLRETVFKDLDLAFREGIAVKIRYVLGRNEPLHPEVIRIWNHEVTVQPS